MATKSNFDSKIAIAAIFLLLPGVTRGVLAAGYQTLTVPAANGDSEIHAIVWSPCARAPAAVTLGPYVIQGTKNCAIAGSSLPLVVISHGQGGSYLGHHDTGAALVNVATQYWVELLVAVPDVTCQSAVITRQSVTSVRYRRRNSAAFWPNKSRDWLENIDASSLPSADSKSRLVDAPPRRGPQRRPVRYSSGYDLPPCTVPCRVPSSPSPPRHLPPWRASSVATAENYLPLQSA